MYGHVFLAQVKPSRDLHLLLANRVSGRLWEGLRNERNDYLPLVSVGPLGMYFDGGVMSNKTVTTKV